MPKVLVWNLEWAKSAARRSKIESILQMHDPDIVCLTESRLGVGTLEMHTVESGSDYGYTTGGPHGRKVILAARTPWTDVDDIGSVAMPPGRFVSGICDGIRCVGVCIPWSHAHVTHGRRDRAAWQEHLAYLRELRSILARYRAKPEPLCVFGDFNQPIPRRWQPVDVFAALMEALTGLKIPTAGFADSDGRFLIDHIAVGPTITVSLFDTVAKRGPDGEGLTDHIGVVARVSTG